MLSTSYKEIAESLYRREPKEKVFDTTTANDNVGSFPSFGLNNII